MRKAAPALLAVLVLASCGEDGSVDPEPSPSPTSTACGGGAPVSGTPTLTTQLVVRGLANPIDLQTPPGDRQRLFVVEQGGRIRIVRAGAIVATPFLDIAARIRSGGEQGLLGLAFHPRYSENGRFYVNYTDRNGDTHVSEFRAPVNADVADPASERELLFVEQPFDNHNGGGLAFGNDGFLYIGLGDGGSGGDPFRSGQNLGTALGKMLRIDVDRGTPFAVPGDNPFVSRAGALPTIWAYGLRNPYRFSFDRSTGDLYIGDVGQNRQEEISVGLVARRGGENYGWNLTEGSLCYPSGGTGCDRTGLTLPVAEYSHADGCSVTGGQVYRGCRMPGYAGTYFYADYCTALVRSFRLQNGQATDARDWSAALGRGLDNPTAFGTDADGEVYVVDYDGEIYKIVPAG
jgi:glucose/arabinose dehydrogenase